MTFGLLRLKDVLIPQSVRYYPIASYVVGINQ